MGRIYKKKLCFIIIVSFFVISGIVYAKGFLKVKYIEFKGLNNLSKYEIINKVESAVENKYILVNLKSLNSVLSENPVIDSFNIDTSNEKLSIVIKEKKLKFFAIKGKGGQVLPFEVDEYGTIISRGKVHFRKGFLVILKNEQYKNGSFTDEVNVVLKQLEMSRKRLKNLFNEIEEVEIFNSTRIRISLKGRDTFFIVNPNMEGFSRLSYLVGYLDRVKLYPKRVDVTDKMIVLSD